MVGGRIYTCGFGTGGIWGWGLWLRGCWWGGDKLDLEYFLLKVLGVSCTRYGR